MGDWTQRVLTAWCGMVLFLSGCSTNNIPNSSKVKTSQVHSNGTIASMQLVSAPHQNPNIKLYKMFYWSQGQMAEAFVTEPKNPGYCPLLVNCHGGLVEPRPDLSHYPSRLSLDSVINNAPHYVSVYPQYCGYGDSEGTVDGILGDTIDTENAITTVESCTSKRSRLVSCWDLRRWWRRTSVSFTANLCIRLSMPWLRLACS